MDKQKLAETAIKHMLAGDMASADLGMELLSISPGLADVKMKIRKNMVNGHNIAHGGIIFALADTAFACACNSHNIVSVAQSCQINFLRPALLGDELVAKAKEIARGKTYGLYNVDVFNQNKKLVASFRGQCASLSRPVVPVVEENK